MSSYGLGRKQRRAEWQFNYFLCCHTSAHEASEIPQDLLLHQGLEYERKIYSVTMQLIS